MWQDLTRYIISSQKNGNFFNDLVLNYGLWFISAQSISIKLNYITCILNQLDCNNMANIEEIKIKRDVEVKSQTGGDRKERQGNKKK